MESKSTCIKGETRFRGWLFQKVCVGFTCMALYISKAWSHNLARIWVYMATYLICVTQALWQQIGHFYGCSEKAARCSKFGVAQNLMWISAYITGGISSLSVWWAEDLNLTGRGSGRWASAHAPTFHDLIYFDCPPICFYWTLKHNNWWWEYWDLAVPY